MHGAGKREMYGPNLYENIQGYDTHSVWANI